MISALLPFARPNAGWLLLLVVLAVGGAYYTGQHIGARDAHAAAEAQRTAEKAAALQQLVDTMSAMSARAAEQATEDFGLATRHAAADRAATAMFSRMQDEVSEYVKTHPVIDGCGLDADGLRVWSAANAGDADAARSPAAGKPDGGVRSAAAAEVGSARGSLHESRGGDGAAVSMSAAP